MDRGIALGHVHNRGGAREKRVIAFHSRISSNFFECIENGKLSHGFPIFIRLLSNLFRDDKYPRRRGNFAPATNILSFPSFVFFFFFFAYLVDLSLNGLKMRDKPKIISLPD